MDETLLEYCNWQASPPRVDAAAGRITGVKILGLTSRNGRRYLPEALAAAAPLYEGAKVNVNHPKGDPACPRDYQDRLGTLSAVTFVPGEGLFGELHFNPRHALAEQLVWDAEHAPHNVGLSHNVLARTAHRDGEVLVEAITKVESVDLVADPATTRGLFEAQASSAALATLTLEALQAARPDLVAAIEGPRAAELSRLQGEVERLTLSEARATRRELIRRLLSEHQLPDPETVDEQAQPVVGGHFLQSLMAAPDEAALRAMIADRAQLIRTLEARAAADARPVARDQHGAASSLPHDGESFARALL